MIISILNHSSILMAATILAAFTLHSGAVLAADSGSIGEPGRSKSASSQSNPLTRIISFHMKIKQIMLRQE